MDEKKLTDEAVAENATTDEIIKAVSYLAKTGEGRGWIDGYKCKVIKFADILDLIHRLQEYREEVHQDRERVHIATTYCVNCKRLVLEKVQECENRLAEQKAEIERLAKVEMDLIGKIADKSAEIERLTEKASYQRLELCKEIAELQKKVENQKAVIIGQAERMEKEKAENKRLYDEFVRLNDFCATKGCICCICENKKTCKECSKCESLKTEKCNNFKIDVRKYARAIERADKLQKQVDELNAENARLNKCVMSEGQVRKCCADMIQDTVSKTEKNTAKEIYEEIDKSDILVVETQEYGEIEVVPIERLKEIIKSKGVEVE